MRRLLYCLGLVGTALLPALAGGCNPLAMGFFTPVPVQPWVAEYMQERMCPSNDYRTPIMPPIPPGHRPLCEDPPDRATILRAMPRVARGVPYIYEEFRDEIDFAVELVADHIDPPRFFPGIGPAQVHHCHWKCTVYFTETVRSDYPLPFRCKRRRTEVVYIDRDHLHMVAPTPETRRSITQDLTNRPLP